MAIDKFDLVADRNHCSQLTYFGCYCEGYKLEKNNIRNGNNLIEYKKLI